MCFMFCRSIAKEFGNEFCLYYITNACCPKLSKAKFVVPKTIKCAVLAAQSCLVLYQDRVLCFAKRLFFLYLIFWLLSFSILEIVFKVVNSNNFLWFYKWSKGPFGPPLAWSKTTFWTKLQNWMSLGQWFIRICDFKNAKF